MLLPIGSSLIENSREIELCVYIYGMGVSSFSGRLINVNRISERKDKYGTRMFFLSSKEVSVVVTVVSAVFLAVLIY